MKRIDDITCCRALFAGWVFAYHLNLQARYAPSFGFLGRLVERGALGVDGFFILSGMVLAYAHPDPKLTLGDARRFWVKRLVRIYPVHLAMISALLLMVGSAYLLHQHPRDPGRFSPGELISQIALVHAWGASDRWSWNYPSWSISAEWAGYLAFPLLWTWLRGGGRLVVTVTLALALAGALAARYLAAADNLSLTYDGGLLRFFPDFIAGMVVVPLLRLWPSRILGRAVALAGVGLMAVGTAAENEMTIIAGLWSLLAGLMAAARQGRGAVLGRVPGFVWLGEISYSFYMSFALVETIQAGIWRSADADPAASPLLYVFTTTVAMLVIATLTWALVERPALRAFAATARRRADRLPYAARM